MLSVIIPVFNEAGSIEQVIRNVQQVALPMEIIVVDDGSTDGTDSILRKLAAASGVKLLRHGRNRGKGAAIRTALAAASGEFVVIQDADLEYNPGDLPALVAPLAAGETDVVYGVRQHDSAARGLMLFIGARLLTMLANLLYGSGIHDEATCYKAFRRSLLDRIKLECDGFDFCPEVTAKICRLGGKIREVPITYRPRASSDGKKLRLRDGFAAVVALLRYRCEPRRRFDRALDRIAMASEARPLMKAPLAIASLLITLAALGTWLWFAKTRSFDPDEFEHLHFAWCIARGMVPYRDFFEHHTPWFHFALAALMPFNRVDRRFDDALAFICLARRIDLALAAVALGLFHAGATLAWNARRMDRDRSPRHLHGVCVQDLRNPARCPGARAVAGMPRGADAGAKQADAEYASACDAVRAERRAAGRRDHEHAEVADGDARARAGDALVRGRRRR